MVPGSHSLPSTSNIAWCLVGVERLTERGLDACDTVLRESVLQGSFAGSDPGQEVLQCLVLIR